MIYVDIIYDASFDDPKHFILPELNDLVSDIHFSKDSDGVAVR